jgi:hypothetical protein
MKKLLVVVIIHSLFVILMCPSTKAQWEGAKVQRLTFDDLPNKVIGLYIDDNDKLYLFYLEGVRDTVTGFVYDYSIWYRTKEKGAQWSQPEEIQTPTYIFGQNRKGGLWMDTRTWIIHLLYVSNGLNYTNSTVPNWEFVKIDSLSHGQNAEYHSFDMDFDSLGNVHLAWHVDFDSIGYEWYKVMYANNSTGEWVKQQVSPPIWLGGMGSGPTEFSVQKNGIVHILYQGDPYCELDCQTSYTRNDGLNSTNWITDTVPKPSRPLWYYGAGRIKVDANDRIHLITGGCIAEDCVWPGLTRTFYYDKQAEDSIWQGPEQIPDTMFGARISIDQLMIDKDGIPHASYFFSSNEEYFTDRRQGSWQVPYYLVGWHGDSVSLMVEGFYFVLDSQGKGHGGFGASGEVYYLSSSNSGVDTTQDHKIFHFNLFQNHPNPFNSSTIIDYEMMKEENVTLKIYDILGKEVRTLVNTLQKPGNYRVTWDGKNNQRKEVASGIYFYQLRAGNFTETKKLILIK